MFSHTEKSSVYEVNVKLTIKAPNAAAAALRAAYEAENLAAAGGEHIPTDQGVGDTVVTAVLAEGHATFAYEDVELV